MRSGARKVDAKMRAEMVAGTVPCGTLDASLHCMRLEHRCWGALKFWRWTRWQPGTAQLWRRLDEGVISIAAVLTTQPITAGTCRRDRIRQPSNDVVRKLGRGE